MKNTSLVILFSILFGLSHSIMHGIGYVNGGNAMLKNVKENCLASGLSEVICSNYIKIIINKEWLRIKIIEHPTQSKVDPRYLPPSKREKLLHNLLYTEEI